jgi:cell division inhibitor SepF
MGIYLGLVEDDDARQYGGRYDSRDDERGRYDPMADERGYADERGRYEPVAEGRHPEERRYPRYRGEDGYDERYDDAGRAPGGYGGPDRGPDRGYAEEVPEPEPIARRVTPARPLGLAGQGPSAGGVRAGGGVSGASASGLAVRESALRDPAVREPAVREAPVREVAPVAAVPEPAPAPPQPYRITTLHPRTYNEARVIGERFRDGMPVIMNLTEMDDADAKRLVDFAAGLSFGLRGSIERVTAKVFLLSPRDVDVTAEDKARIREGGFFNQS